jgi:hypothetical protein
VAERYLVGVAVNRFKAFATWADVVTAAHQSVVLFYHAPFDIDPKRVRVARVFKNGKIRIAPSRVASGFTADAGHLNRFRKINVESV